MAGIGEDYVSYKVRVRNSNIQKGKSAGYQVIYQAASLKSKVILGAKIFLAPQRLCVRLF
ncbi:hypothetical protein F7734_41235 [Scytonema sp. UIC 10036]|uniref:hypothetical protein n=1 Tax=Scytonema sp. UIC 10036 TaxID=2304196 RepID=UPI0012DA94CC|nr:hypothetical protein [Scytonema sp. UIC 10036]